MILTGLARLGRDAEVRYTQDGTAVATLSLAYSYGKKDAEGKRPTQWVNAALWGERAEKLAPYLLKGQQLSVVLDDVHVETYGRREGGIGVNLKARVVSLEFAVPKPAEGDGGGKPATTGAYRKAGKEGAFDDMDDDIHF